MKSRRYTIEGSIEAINDWAYENGWTDGLPVLPATPERVDAMMATVDLPPQHVVAVLPPRNAEATIEKIAANAVMAGCRPEYFPVVVAAVEACADTAFSLLTMNTTTNPAGPMLIVNGPIRDEIRLNSSWGVLGPGYRANATIGRAVNLVMLNVGGRRPGEECKTTHGHPGRYTMCVAEYEEKNPWQPLHVERGFAPQDSTVTVISAAGFLDILDMDSKAADGLLATIASSIQSVGLSNLYPLGYGKGEMAVLLCPDHAALLATKYTKAEVQQALLERTSRIPLAMFPEHRQKILRARKDGQLEGDSVRLAARPDQFLLVVAGGLGGLHTVFVPTLGSNRAVTRKLPAAPGTRGPA